MAAENPIPPTTDKKIINSIFYTFFDKPINTNPPIKHPVTEIQPKEYNRVVFIVSNFIIPAKMIPPNTNLAISIKNFPVSDKTTVFLSFSINANI